MSSKGLVLVTGANGYVAQRTIEAFLNAGYSVRGTVRNRASADGLLAALPEAASSGTLEIVEVPDITVDGAFDAAVRGVAAIAHLASPVSFSFTDAQYVVNTAVHGVKSILASALAEPGIRNFVYMASVSSVMGEDTTTKVWTEADWCEWALALVAKEGNSASGRAIYSASKTLAEREFWKAQEEKKPKFTMTAIHPVFIAGPPLVLPDTPEGLNETTKFISDVLQGAEKPSRPSPFGAYVDVRDVARLVVFGVESADVADGQRYIAAAGWASDQAAADILRRAYPERKDVIRDYHPDGPGSGYLPDFSWLPKGPRFDTSKAVRDTGSDWISPEKTIIDAAKAFEVYLKP
ncbi:hypothetical protein BX600DRAFT_460812 [Xylariales sp. PMI_506]|nr:hypothetical protein BX600DRAFT_460812 [Xylariales sp. PMI_506]